MLEHPNHGLEHRPMRTTSPSAKSELVEQADEKTVKRAQWESFSFELEAPGMVLVTNDSYDDDGHSYLVNVETDVPVACECKAFEYGDGSCKHMIAVAIREPVLMAAQSRQQPTPIPDARHRSLSERSDRLLWSGWG